MISRSILSTSRCTQTQIYEPWLLQGNELFEETLVLYRSEMINTFSLHLAITLKSSLFF